MPWMRSTGRMVVGGVTIFALGCTAGAGALGAVAARASRAYLFMSQIAFRIEEEQQASAAWRGGDFEAAAGHTFCVVEAEHGPAALKAFRSEELPWRPFSYFFDETVIIEPNQPAKTKSEPIREAADRAMLAVAYERLGRTDAATREYARIHALTGTKDVESWRWLGLQTIDGWSKLQEQRSAPPAPGNQAAP